MAKFKVGDKVKVVKYGHLFWENSNGRVVCHDMLPNLVGLKGIVQKVSETPITETHDEVQYSLKGINQKTAWYNEEQLEKVTIFSIIKDFFTYESKKRNKDRS